MKRVQPDTYFTGPAAHAQRASEAAVIRRLDALLTPDVAERVVDSLSRFVTAPVFWTLNLVVAAWWMIVNSEIIPGMVAFDPSGFILFYFVIPTEALCLVVLVGLNRHYLRRKTDKLEEIKKLMSRLEDNEAD